MSVYGKKALHHWRYYSEEPQRYEHSDPNVQLLILKKWYPLNDIFVYSQRDEDQLRVVGYKQNSGVYYLILLNISTNVKSMVYPLEVVPFIDTTKMHILRSDVEVLSKYIKIDLRKCINAKEFEALLQENGITPDQCKGNVLVELKAVYDFIFLDPKEFNIMFFIYRAENAVMMFDTHLDYLKIMKPISSNYLKSNYQLSLDNILDKINKHGIDSLTLLEKKFLKNI
jgi:hypothetical protein